uniref:Uncharacterized protein n=1 Tax=Helianthus annuus TaxID=4232 RepID=A0A251V416_HELAN
MLACLLLCYFCAVFVKKLATLLSFPNVMDATIDIVQHVYIFIHDPREPHFTFGNILFVTF